MNIESGNLNQLNTENTGWFIGYSDWVKSGGEDLRFMSFDKNSKGLCVKWFAHEIGFPNGEPKPISTGRTISLLVDEVGKFKIEFSESERFTASSTKSYMLKKSGDYVIWGENLYHRAFCLAPSTILTIRWEPED